MTPNKLYCNAHFTIFDPGQTCPFHGVVPCPKPKEVDPEKMVVISCGRCDLSRVIPAAAIMQSTAAAKLGRPCRHDRCSAKVISYASHIAASALVPPPISDADISAPPVKASTKKKA